MPYITTDHIINPFLAKSAFQVLFETMTAHNKQEFTLQGKDIYTFSSHHQLVPSKSAVSILHSWHWHYHVKMISYNPILVLKLETSQWQSQNIMTLVHSPWNVKTKRDSRTTSQCTVSYPLAMCVTPNNSSCQIYLPHIQAQTNATLLILL